MKHQQRRRFNRSTDEDDIFHFGKTEVSSEGVGNFDRGWAIHDQPCGPLFAMLQQENDRLMKVGVTQ